MPLSMRNEVSRLSVENPLRDIKSPPSPSSIYSSYETILDPPVLRGGIGSNKTMSFVSSVIEASE